MTKTKLSLGQLCLALFFSIKARKELECCATQDAIDEIAQAFRGRDGLDDVLSRGRSDEGTARLVFFEIMEGWVRPGLLELATGRSRDQWLELVS
jgi:hypothetical protein